MKALDLLFASQAAMAAQQAQQAQQAEEHARSDASRPSARGNYTYRHTHSRPPEPGQPKALVRLMRRPANTPRTRTAVENEPPHDLHHTMAHDELHAVHPEVHHPEQHHAGAAMRRTANRRNTSSRQQASVGDPPPMDMSQIGADDGEDDEDEDEDDISIPVRRPQPPPTQLLARCGVPEAAALFVRARPGPPTPEEQHQALASTLLCAARQRSAKPQPNQATHTATVIAAAQVCLSSQASAQAEPMTLGQVKALLMELSPNPGLLPAGPDRVLQQNALALLPLHVLNATRPRTEQQRKLADDRLQLLRHAMSR